MLYEVIDLNTGKTVAKARTETQAQQKCEWLDDLHAWVDSHTFTYKLVTE